MSQTIHSETELDEIMTRPRPVLVEAMRRVQSPLVILGGGGKMGPTLAWMARRAAEEAGNPLEVVSISRFSNPAARRWLDERGVRTLSLDLMQREAYAHLPDSGNVLYLVGLKFGTTQDPAATWATMALIPSFTCERYPTARIVALSSGNVYPPTGVDGPGSCESDPLIPLGEYANACVARERIFEYYAHRNAFPLALVRLFYAVDLRYGVLLDVAQKVDRGEAVDLTTGYINCIWQGDANEFILRSLGVAGSPPFVYNLTGPKRVSVRDVALSAAEMLGREPHLQGDEAPTALLANTERMVKTFGAPPTPVDQALAWTAAWVRSGGRTLNKPTHFETRDGRY